MEVFLKMPSSTETETLSDQKEVLCFKGHGVRNLCSLHMPQEDSILLRKAMEITSQELQVYYSSRNKLLPFKNVKNTADDKCRLVSKKSAAASGSHEAVRNCSTIASKGKEILQANAEVEEVDKRLMKLEEETEAMKQTFIESIEERKLLVNEISERLRRIHLCYCLGKQANENGSLVAYSSSKHAAMETGLSQVLTEDSNPCIVNRYHRSTMHFSNSTVYSSMHNSSSNSMKFVMISRDNNFFFFRLSR
ncbi:hypothetical protein Ddye_011574 [Dipteronia dyeriana]|uniref:Uncharacterized protein n=1 Tax=Dipteronia dyeriana TaxID=168575 RepID=A0AAE0CIC4_9ROSI|nr:hypothetical protein Ddye_011574 [Dipteronia dyeriana]